MRCSRFACRRRSWSIPRLAAAHDGLKIAHVTDLHFSGRIERAFFEHVVDATNAMSPDIVAVTGDIVEGDQFLDWIPPTLGRLRGKYGVYYVLGNHDRRATEAKLKAAMAEAGLIHVGGKWQQILVDGAPIVIAGNELPWYKPAADLSDCPNAEESGRPLRLLLAHSPDQFRWARENDVDLMLAGHLHGGQVRLPLLGAITSPSIHGVRYVCGVFREGNTVMHVSRGVGSLTPVRLNCPPEIAVLTLRPAATNRQLRQRAAASNLLDFDADAAGADRLVHRREPELVLPVQAERFAQLHELLAVVRAAVPNAARPRAGEIVFRREQQHPAALAAARAKSRSAPWPARARARARSRR